MYASVVCRSNFSFLHGASHPEELVDTAAKLQLSGLALTDNDGLYGTVKAHLAAQAHGLKTMVAARLTLSDAPDLCLYAQNAVGYGNLCQLLSDSHLSHPKGQPSLSAKAVAARNEGLLALVPFPTSSSAASSLVEAFGDRFYFGLFRGRFAGDERRVTETLALSNFYQRPCVAHSDVHTHCRERQPLQDVLTAIRHHCTVADLGERGFPNGERTLQSVDEMRTLFDDVPEAVARSVELSERCAFTLSELRYQFPMEWLPRQHTPASYLHLLVQEGLLQRYPQGTPADVQRQIEHELKLIVTLSFEGYFLAIWDLVRFARSRNILCQGRGSAANSAVCYALGITAIDPVRMGLLFERFISMERKEPPDIDVDFEHERREEVIQYVYEKHGRHRAAMVAAVVCYRSRLALRETGKALGLALDQVDKLTKHVGLEFSAQALHSIGLSAEEPLVRQTLALASQLDGFPRHLSIHSGGFVLTGGQPLSEIVPIEPATMPGRTVVQWDKDDCAAVGLLKVDLLSLGMLTALAKCLALIERHDNVTYTLANIPAEDPQTYEMLGQADSIGVFQIESRAQMQMLPRLAPKTFYDLVIEVAIIRPGPILGDMVHPYLRRRDGTEPVTYPSNDVKDILGRTLGVPLFQEQAMKLAIAIAGFTPGEADGLRRAISHKQAEAKMAPYLARFVQGGIAKGYDRTFIENCFKQFRGFSGYGFPESHAASFALLAYASSWLKCHYPAAFTAAILNSQPMGFYAPHTLVEDAKRHGVTVLPVDICHSQPDCTLENGALRLGLRLVRGLTSSSLQRLAQTPRQNLDTLEKCIRHLRLPRHDLVRLALASAFSRFGERRQVLWHLQGLAAFDEGDLFFGMACSDAEPVELPVLSAAERVSMDYETTQLSLLHHPLALMRPQLTLKRAVTAERLAHIRNGSRVRLGGMSICRQRPPTAKGVAFLSLEDETGIANVVIPPELFERQRKEILGALFLTVDGVVERTGKVINIKARAFERLAMPSG
jgi:error-prone DNA polymerase